MSLSSFKVPYFSKKEPILVQQDHMDDNTRAIVQRRMKGEILLFGQTSLGRLLIVRKMTYTMPISELSSAKRVEAKLYGAEDGSFVFMPVKGGPTLRLREIKGACNIDVPPKVWEELMAQLVVQEL
jgi:hypothetical protein